MIKTLLSTLGRSCLPIRAPLARPLGRKFAMLITVSRVAALAAATAATPLLAQAQVASTDQLRTDTQDPFSRDRSISVRERAWGTMTGEGLPFGGFRLFPTIAVGLERNDNIRTTQTGEVDDSIYRLGASAELRSDWNRHALNFRLDGDSFSYADNGDEDANRWTAGVEGRLDTTRFSRITGGATYASRFEPRSDFPGGASPRSPVEFDEVTLSGGIVQTFNRLRAAGIVKRSDRDYKDGRTLGGAVLDQDDRDRNTTTVDGRLEYALSPALSGFVTAGYRATDYDRVATGGIDQSSSGARALVGASFDLTNLVRGEFSVGTITVDYDRLGAPELSGVTTFNRLDFFATELVTVTGVAERDIEESEIVTSSGRERSTVGLSADWELRRNIIVGANHNWTWWDYSGIDREDRRVATGLNVTYQIHSMVGLEAEVTRENQRSGGAQQDRDFDQNRFSVAVVFRR